MVAVGAVNAALRWIGENAFVERGLADALGDVLVFGKRFSRRFVLDEFDAEEQPEATDLAYVRMRFQRGEFGAQSFAGGRDAVEELMRLDVIEDGVAGGRRDRMRLIRETVLEGARAAFECGRHARRNEDSAERRVAAGDSLPYQDDVRLNVPVLHGERFFGAAHATHDFIGD